MEEGGEAGSAKPNPTVAQICEECKANPSKYKCPGCSIRSCSLPCVKAHKLRTGCTGKRNQTNFVPLSQIDNNQLLSGTFPLFKFILCQRSNYLCESFFPTRKIEIWILNSVPFLISLKFLMVDHSLLENVSPRSEYLLYGSQLFLAVVVHLVKKILLLFVNFSACSFTCNFSW